jgi:hypothetical protein
LLRLNGEHLAVFGFRGFTAIDKVAHMNWRLAF